MRNNLVILERVGFYGLSTAHSQIKVWEFPNYRQAECKLHELYVGELNRISDKQDCELKVATTQSSFYSAEFGQFKIIGDDVAITGILVTGNENENVDGDYIGVNLGPNPED